MIKFISIGEEEVGVIAEVGVAERRTDTVPENDQEVHPRTDIARDLGVHQVQISAKG